MCTILVSTYYTTCPSYLKRNQFFWLFVNCSGLKSAKLEKGQ
ncbi:hypothetical protein ERS069941_00112, partial [Streptococcus pneumoniae]